MKAGGVYALLVCFQNTAVDTWTDAGSYRLGDVPNNTGAFLTLGGPTAHRIYLTGLASVPQNSYVTFAFQVAAPSTPGTYTMQWQMIQDGVASFGALSTALTVTVTAGRIHTRALRSGKAQLLTEAVEGVYYTERTQANFSKGTLSSMSAATLVTPPTAPPRSVQWRARFWQGTSANVSLGATNFSQLYAQTPLYEAQLSTVHLVNYAAPGGSSFDGGSGASQYLLGRFDGNIVPSYSEPYTFTFTYDDSVAIYINGALGFANVAATTSNWVSPMLTAGQQYTISVVWFNVAGPGQIGVQWQSASQSPQYTPSAVNPVGVYAGLLTLSGANTSGSRVSPAVALGPLGKVGASATVSFTGTTPAASTITVTTSIDGGASYQALGSIAAGNTNQTVTASIPGLPAGTALTPSQSLLVKVAMTSNGVSQPSISRLSSRIDAPTFSVRNDGSTYASEVQELQPYRAAVMADAPLLYWRMHDRLNTPYVADISGNGNVGTLPNPSWVTFGGSDAITEPGETSLAVAQASVTNSPVSASSSVTSAVTPPQNVGTGAGFTFECWLKVPLATTSQVVPNNGAGSVQGTSGQMFVWYPINSGGNAGVGLAAGTNCVQVFENGSAYMPCLASYAYPTSNTAWTHIAVVYNNQTPTIYVNGSAVTTGLQSARGVSICPTILGTPYGTAPAFSIAECAVYGAALSAGRILAHYQAGATLVGTKWSYKGAPNSVKFLVPAYLEEGSAFA